MRIGIVADVANSAAKTGVEHYAEQLVLHLVQIDRRNDYTLYLRSEPSASLAKLGSNVELKVMPFPALWTLVRVSWELLIRPVDVLLVPTHRLPIIHPRRSVITWHDTSSARYPETDTLIGRSYLRWSYRRVARSAWRIIAPSEAIRRDITKLFPSSAARIAVVHHGYERVKARSLPPSAKLDERLPRHYVLYLSTIQPRKNLLRLIEAFTALKRAHPELPHRLVIAGKLGWKTEGVTAAISRNPDKVVYLGYVEDADRWPLYRRADLFVLPSIDEGFGLGVLEAFHCGVPVAVSQVASLREVAGDAAIYFDPYDVADMCSSMARGLTDQELRAELVQRGVARLDLFSWERCARETLQVLTYSK